LVEGETREGNETLGGFLNVEIVVEDPALTRLAEHVHHRVDRRQAADFLSVFIHLEMAEELLLPHVGDMVEHLAVLGASRCNQGLGGAFLIAKLLAHVTQVCSDNETDPSIGSVEDRAERFGEFGYLVRYRGKRVALKERPERPDEDREDAEIVVATADGRVLAGTRASCQAYLAEQMLEEDDLKLDRVFVLMQELLGQ